ncbi:MAG: NifB/NifX family molybdenum-iron cluster-binding protein [Campylobacterota bacterium]|nr:NifB/NifX family molybdenum-iron cluster-binding protein [Campylobacterota bacterium]
MKIAIPVKMNKENPPVAPLFGKAKWFAIVEDGKVNIEPNPVEGGRAVIEWFDELGVDTIIIQEMGEGPYSVVQKLGTMKIYHSGFERILLDDVLKKFEENTLPLVDDAGMAKIIAHHEVRHPHDHHHHH